MVKSPAVRHQRGGSENALAMCVNNSSVHVSREAEIIGVDNQTLQTDLEDMQLNSQELLRIRAEILQQIVQLTSSSGSGIVKLWINQKLPKGTLTGIYLIDRHI